MDICIALVIRIVTMCHFRLGNEKYKSLYKSYGVSTIEVRHLKFAPGRVKIAFVGKKGVKNDCIIDAPDVVMHLANMSAGKQPREPVFTYTSDRIPIKATDINTWMRQFGVDITSKMFRTYATNIMLIARLNELAPPESKSTKDRKQTINAALDEISGAVHNTRAVCKGQYAHPDIIEMYLNHPRIYKTRFMSGIAPEPAFLGYLRSQL
jgi:DNA topoisomerase-1